MKDRSLVFAKPANMNEIAINMAIISSDAESILRAQELAATLGLPFLPITDTVAAPSTTWLLVVSDTGLAMRQGGPRAAGAVSVDFVGGKMGFRRQRQEATPAIVKAVGVRAGMHPQVWDLTAGLGQDAFILARHGCKVTLFERNPLVHLLLADGLDRARRFAEHNDPQLLSILGRLTLIQADSLDVLNQTSDDQPQVISIDTMFPERTKSAKVKKEMQLFQEVVGKDSDADELFTLALTRAAKRVIVKRPRHAPPLAGRQPNVTFTGKSIRFDVYTRST